MEPRHIKDITDANKSITHGKTKNKDQKPYTTGIQQEGPQHTCEETATEYAAQTANTTMATTATAAKRHLEREENRS